MRHRRTTPLALAVTLLTWCIACTSDDGTFVQPEPEPEPDGTCSIPEGLIVSGGVAQDGIPALSDPGLVAVDDPGAAYLRDFDRVIGIEVDGSWIAVPHNILWWHEIVNFNSLGTPLAVTYCPLTGSSMVFDRTSVGGAEFGVSGLLYQNNLMMYDRTGSSSLWPQMIRGARCGPRDGDPLQMYAAVEMRWDAWVEAHPESMVVSSATGWGRNYRIYPYGDYESLNNPETLFPHGEHDRRRPPKERVLAIPYSGGNGIALPFGELEGDDAFRAIHVDADGDPVLVLWDRDARSALAFRPSATGQSLTFEVRDGRFVDVETESAWSFEGVALSGTLAGARLERVPEAYVAFWFAWSTFVPGTFLWSS